MDTELSGMAASQQRSYRIRKLMTDDDFFREQVAQSDISLDDEIDALLDD